MKLYNTRTRGVHEFVPLRDRDVRIYVCGLTPSAQAHLGHARSFLFFDVLRRYLTHRGYRVTYVQNVTDIDDRSINTAKETGETYRDVVTRYYNEFKDSMRKLEVLPYDYEPYATDYIGEIQAVIRQLIERAHAYVAPEGIYYRVASFPRYGELSNRNVGELEAGARIEIDEHKEDPLDFALWKFAKAGEPSWPFDPYGDGRPGWHIECSAMAESLLDPDGTGIDIHGGGADLIFPHHENEIAQSEPLMQRPPMANVWVHGGLLLFDNRKMAKSLGNFEPLVDLLQRHDPQAIRWLFLQTGYRKVMNFTEESIAAAATGLARIKSAYRTVSSPAVISSSPGVILSLSKDDPTLMLDARMEAALDDDMNTAAAIAVLYEFASAASATPQQSRDSTATFERLRYWLGVLGITSTDAWLEEPAATLPPDFVTQLQLALAQDSSILATIDGASPQEAVERIVRLRDEARREKDWSTSDRLRAVLQRCGVEINDSKEGTTWSYVSTAPL
ncbi:MAG: cysteine--tRNA ligase [Candidatus Eremiobacteraeota bacterium]|nr:cysteine--tRNA ligase [Candidatus Eremiobacteraeota bacterium]